MGGWTVSHGRDGGSRTHTTRRLKALTLPLVYIPMVRRMGVEPIRSYQEHKVLSLAWLPLHHLRAVPTEGFEPTLSSF